MRLQRGVFGILDRAAESGHRDRPAFGFEGDVRTFRQIRDRALEVAEGLAGQGVCPGDRVAVMMDNRMEWVEIYYAVAAMGAICVPINVLLSGPEITHVCADSAADFLIMDEIAMTSIAKVAHSFKLVVTVGDAVAPEELSSIPYRELAQGNAIVVPPDLGDTFILYYSSGTTGLPKGAEHTHDGVLWNAMGQLQGLGLTSRVRYLAIPSLSWAAGFHNLMMSLVWVGGYSEIRRTGAATAERIVELVRDAKITHTFIVPSILREFARRPELLAQLADTDLEWVVTGSEPVPKAVIEACAAGLPGVVLCQGYGQSEFPSITTVLAAEDIANHEGSAGRALPHSDLAIQDSRGVVRRSGRGELLVRSLATMRGYFNKPKETAEAFRDGWLHTGDLVDLDDEGFVTIVGRTKDMIISGGLNIYPKEIEEVIHRVPGVREAAVVGMPHDKFGEAPIAVVVVDDTDFDTVLVDRACAEQLASYKRPRTILVRSEPLPRSANSKILKRELRPWVAAELGLEIET